MTRPLAQCRGCGAAIRWITMRDSGRAMPVDPERRDEWIDDTAGTAAGPLTLIADDGVAITGRRATVLDPDVRRVEGYVPHWAACPARGQFRRETGA